jgi:V/A-type H+-transporting ATPase subunit E
MGIENVAREVKKSAKSEAKKIVKDAEKEAKRILEEAKKLAEKKVSEAKIRAEKEAARYERREVASTHLSQKKELLKAEEEAVKQVVEESRRLISAMDKRMRTKLTKRCVQAAMRELPEAALYYCNAQDKQTIGKAFPGLRYAGSIKVMGGVVLESKDGSVRVDYTFDRILKELEEEKVDEIRSRLFG